MLVLRHRVRFAVWQWLTVLGLRSRGVRCEISAADGPPVLGSMPRVRLGNACPRSLSIDFAARVRLGRAVVIELAHGDAALRIGEGTTIGDHVSIRLRNGDGDPWEHRATVGTIDIGPRCQIRSHVVIRCLHRLTIGEDVMISHFAVVHCGAGTTIGPRCVLAERVTVADTDHGFDDHHSYAAQNVYAPIELEANVLVSANSVITRGVRIPGSVTVAAGSVVTAGPWRSGTLIGGVPARELREYATT
jgi:acetyltransferase-like isoleucine patch superfamily enzyme